MGRGSGCICGCDGLATMFPALTPVKSCGWRPRPMLGGLPGYSWHTPSATPHSNRPRSRCHNIFPSASQQLLCGAPTVAALTTSPRSARREGRGGRPQAGTWQRQLLAPAEGKAACLGPSSRLAQTSRECSRREKGPRGRGASQLPGCAMRPRRSWEVARLGVSPALPSCPHFHTRCPSPPSKAAVLSPKVPQQPP